uniref:Uncharacterized protein n=1 Tax=Candidatus Kentrum sp. LFY TaxID=2126342 RepID=A0A450VAJ2_9GAMM|nr:MAG: hypothetical protein BECKLFY1418B_GA0070995_11543 [Candidatus Kentron sp. LFY]VFK01806.1 MAG: hypothetical protein BECKLFY1418A_GA0070994_11622 [Candidatus Kentron sp. LFY]
MKLRLEPTKHDSCIGKAKLLFYKTRLIREAEREINESMAS